MLIGGSGVRQFCQQVGTEKRLRRRVLSTVSRTKGPLRGALCYARSMTTNLARYERIAPFYDLLDLPFKRNR